MPNRDFHRPFGAACGFAAAYALARAAGSPHPVVEGLAAMLGGWIGAMLPDRIEPADSPRHRRFFHSWCIALVGGGVSVAGLLAWQRMCRQKAAAAPTALHAMAWCAAAGVSAGMIAGYLSHLATDACSAQGLPVFA